MSRWRTHGRDDDLQTGLRDHAMIGVDERDPRTLKPGYASRARNKRFVDGVAETRLGFRTVSWGKDYAVDFPIDFPFDFHEAGFQTVYGAGVFSDPNSNEGGLIATPSGVWRIAPNQEPQLIPLPTDVVLSADVKFVQCFDRMLMFRGTGVDDTPLGWNPQQDFTEGIRSFEAIEQTAARGTEADNTYGDGAVTIPNVRDATLFNNRIYLLTGRDYLTISDILDYTRYNPVTQVFRINSGSDDRLMKAVGFNPSTMVCFKDQSIMLLNNVYGDLSVVTARWITKEYGLVAPEAWAYVGKDVWFLSEGHVRSLALTAENELQAVADPVSEPMKDFMSRINWNAIGGAVAAQHDADFHLAVPIDGAQYNNAIATWSGDNKAWMGYWDAPDFLDVKSFIKMDYGGRKRLFIVQGHNFPTSTRAHGAVLLVGEGFTDDVYGTKYQISDRLLSRGFGGEVLDNKYFSKGHIDQSTWNPTFSTNMVVDGVSETYSLHTPGVTKSRTTYYTWGKTAWDGTNVNDDHAEPDREDYSISLESGAAIDAGTNGLDPSRMQRVKESYPLLRRGQYCQLEMLSRQGRRNIHAMEIEASIGKRSYETEA